MTTRTLLPLLQYYTPPALLCRPRGVDDRAAPASAASAAAAASLHFDRALDTVCNLAVSPAGSARAAAASSAAMTDVCAVAWVPPPRGAASRAAAVTATSSAAAAAAAAAPAAPKPAQALWLVAVLPSGAVRAVCPTAGAVNAAQLELVAAVPAADVPKNEAKSAPLFSPSANSIVCFATPRGTPVHAAPERPAVVQPRGRGTAHPTKEQQPVAAASQLLAAGAGVNHNFAARDAMISTVCFRGDSLHTLLLDCCPAASAAATGSASWSGSVAAAAAPAIATVAAHSLGRHTGPPPRTFHTIDACSLQHVALAERHLVLVLLRGRAVGGEKTSAFACFELQRRGPESLTVDTSTHVLAAVTRLGWTVVGGGGGARGSRAADGAAAAGTTASSTTTVNASATPSCASVSVSGRTSAAGDAPPKLHLAFAFAGVPALVTVGELQLPLASSAAAGTLRSCPQALTVNSKHPIVRVVALAVANGLELLAVLTRDNAVQVFCAVQRAAAPGGAHCSGLSPSLPASSTDPPAGSRRQRTADASAADVASAALAASWRAPVRQNHHATAVAAADGWPLLAPRGGSAAADACVSTAVTLLCAVTTPAATAQIPVDDVALHATVRDGVVVGAVLVLAMGNGHLQTLGVLGVNGAEPTIEVSDRRSVLLSTAADYETVSLALSPALAHDGRCAAALVFGSHIVVMRPQPAAV